MNENKIFSHIKEFRSSDPIVLAVKEIMLDEVHLSSKAVKKLVWSAIHAENSGEMDIDNKAIVDHCLNTGSSALVVMACVDLINNTKESINVFWLEDITEESMRNIQNALVDNFMPNSLEYADLAYKVSFSTSVSFNYPLSMILLRERDGYGWSTLAGPEELTEKVKKCNPELPYKWRDGVLPLEVGGGRNPG